MNLPTTWEATGMNIDGSVWFRKTVDITPAMAGRELTLNLGIVDDYDTTYFNGVKIGGIGKETVNPWSIQRQYKLPAALVRPGRNVIAVRRVRSLWLGRPDRSGRLHGHLRRPVRRAAGRAVEIPDRAALEPKPAKPMPMTVPSSDDPNQLAVLYNGMIAPLIPLAIACATWYQGESNAAAAFRYRRYFPLMIEDWRRRWNAQLPFIFVEVANLHGPQANPIEAQTWPGTARGPVHGPGDPQGRHGHRRRHRRCRRHPSRKTSKRSPDAWPCGRWPMSTARRSSTAVRSTNR